MLKVSEAGEETYFKTIRSECGLVSIFLTRKGREEKIDIRSLTYKAATDLQHRAEGAAGFWITNGVEQKHLRELGTVAVAFQEGRSLPFIQDGFITIAHLRYPTSGSSNHKQNIQPFRNKNLWFGHHGNLTNPEVLEELLPGLQKGGEFPDSDSWIALNLIEQEKGNLAEKVIKAQKKFEGAWAMIISDGKHIVACRDPYGIRPLFVGYIYTQKDPLGFILSVETNVFKKLGVDEYREVLPGETLTIDEAGIKTVSLSPKGRMSCIFEFVYMSHPISEHAGKNVYEVRRKSGELLWKESPISLLNEEKLIVMPVPNSGRPAALGYYYEALKELKERVLWDEGLIANAYFGRNFLKSTGKRAADVKFDAIPQVFSNKTVVLIDDSIVRGDTMPQLVKLCRNAGAKKVHARIVSPEIKHPCFWGVAFPTYTELLANKIPNMEEREKYLEVDSLAHLSIGGLLQAVGRKDSKIETTIFQRNSGYCTHCFDKKGPPMENLRTISLQE